MKASRVYQYRINKQSRPYKEFKLACEAPLYLPYTKLNYFQGELKSLSKTSYEKLKQEIVNTGFAFPIHAWCDKDGEWWIIGGHQRWRTVKQMIEKDGFDPVDLPVVPVHAKDRKAAKRRIMQDVSQYGKLDEDGLYEFMADAGLEINDTLESFDLPDLDLDKFAEHYFGIEDESQSGTDGKEYEHVCPACGHTFGG